jgi:protein TonB
VEPAPAPENREVDLAKTPQKPQPRESPQPPRQSRPEGSPAPKQPKPNPPVETDRVSTPGTTRGAQVRNAIKPEYPRASVRRGQEGTVLIEADVSPAGRVLAGRVIESSGHPRLDRSALRAVRAARFVPALENGTPVADTVRVPIRFRLRN